MLIESKGFTGGYHVDLGYNLTSCEAREGKGRKEKSVRHSGGGQLDNGVKDG